LFNDCFYEVLLVGRMLPVSDYNLLSTYSKSARRRYRSEF